MMTAPPTIAHLKGHGLEGLFLTCERIARPMYLPMRAWSSPLAKPITLKDGACCIPWMRPAARFSA